MLVVNFNALQTVHFLNFRDDILGQFADPQQTQNVMRVAWSVRDNLTTVDLLTFKHVEVAPLVNQLFIWVAAISWRNHQTTLALGFLAEGNGTADFSQDGGFFRPPRFKQVGNPWQTTGNVAGFGGFLRDTGNHVTNADGIAIVKADNRVCRQKILRDQVGTGNQQVFALLVDQLDRRAHVFTSGWTLLRIHYLDAAQAGQFISLTLDGNTAFHADKLHNTSGFTDNRVGMRKIGRAHV